MQDIDLLDTYVCIYNKIPTHASVYIFIPIQLCCF